jgi:hypothetical protein
MHGQLEEILSDIIGISERIPRSVLEHDRNTAPAGLRGASSASQHFPIFSWNGKLGDLVKSQNLDGKVKSSKFKACEFIAVR